MKGFSASYTGEYNAIAKPQFSVGECWDGSSTIKNWINGTKVNGEIQSAAFDFQFRYRVRDAVHQNNWRLLAGHASDGAGYPLIYQKDYQRYAVTFVENHDTERRSGSEQDPLKADTLAANAFMLAMPGTPCVFLKHWQAQKYPLKRMISARKLAGITNQSTYEQKASQQLYYAVATQGTRGTLICVVGKTPNAYSAPAGFTKIISGTDYCYYISDALVSEWNTIEQRIQSEYEAEQEEFQPHTATIYVRDELNWSRMNFYIWDSNNNSQLNGNWPGKQITDTKVINGYTWYYQTININAADYFVNFVFSTNNGSPQTIDVTEVSEDKFFVIKSAQIDGKYYVEEDLASGIATTSSDDVTSPRQFFTLDGRPVFAPTRPGVYILRQGNQTKKININY